MYQVHGWFELSESADESDLGGLAVSVGRIQQTVSESAFPSMVISTQALNGQYFLTITGYMNRRREEATLVEDVLEYVCQVLPGSYGLLYERDDESADPPGGNAFRVTVMARGELSVRDDPFLSPCNPTIES